MSSCWLQIGKQNQNFLRRACAKEKAATASAGTSKSPTISDINERIDKLVVFLKSASLNQNDRKGRNGNLGTP